MMVWQAHERNEWDVAIHQSLEAAEAAVAVASGGPDPFSLADPPAVTEILEAAGFADVTFTDVCEPVYYGPDVAAALDWVRGFTYTSETLKRLDPAAAERAVRRLREALTAHTNDDVSGSTPAPGSSPLIAAEGNMTARRVATRHGPVRNGIRLRTGRDDRRAPPTGSCVGDAVDPFPEQVGVAAIALIFAAHNATAITQAVLTGNISAPDAILVAARPAAVVSPPRVVLLRLRRRKGRQPLRAAAELSPSRERHQGLRPRTPPLPQEGSQADLPSIRWAEPVASDRARCWDLSVLTSPL
jgi:hypothetical protein